MIKLLILVFSIFIGSLMSESNSENTKTLMDPYVSCSGDQTVTCMAIHLPDGNKVLVKGDKKTIWYD
ncbi:MAG: hypothetical protein ED557_13425 [Balneola sp.]|nr:MAG: hypothetical protein ED557_13425 [Balneola sp.]